MVKPLTRILLVEDNPGDARLVREALSETGGLAANVVHVNRLSEALSQVGQERFAAVLLDLSLPDSQKLEGLAAVREKSPGTPVIVLTGLDDESLATQAVEAGAQDYLVKGRFDSQVLSRSIRYAIERQRALGEAQQRREELHTANRLLEAANAELQQANSRVRELDQLKTQFFANVSHELRTPLALILGPAEQLLRSGRLGPQEQNRLETIERNARMLLKHVNDLLDIAKLEAGKMNLSVARTDLGNLFHRTAANFETVAETRQVGFSIDAPHQLRAEVDADKIERVLLNLFSNAFKFVPDGGSVVCRLRSSGGEQAEIIVEDSGPGIPADLREAVFERFRQLDGGLTRRLGGTGLGLAIVKDFVVLHRGTVDVDQSPLGGARFTVRLPLAAAPDVFVAERGEETPLLWPIAALAMPARGPREASPPVSAGNDQPRVLVVEDNHEMREFLAGLLAADYRVTTARNGREGLEQSIADPPDLIITDLMMPEMSGDELLRTAREREELKAVPILMLTARADEETIVQLLRKGADDYLTKPVAADELKVRVGNLVNTKRTRDLLQTALASHTHNLAELGNELQAALNALRQNDDLLRKALLDSEQANRTKDEFLTILSHELRTPLTAILGWIGILRQGNPDPEAATAGLEVIDRSAQLQAALIEEILDASRIITGKIRLRLESVSLPELVLQVIEGIRPAASAKRIELDVRVSEDAPRIAGDANRLQQIVWNLLSNAVKFTPGGGRVSVTLEQTSRLATLVVSDTGPGIPEDFLPYVFDRFRQADSSNTRRHGGLGLGLSIVRYLAELHGGVAIAESAGEGKGSTFRVSIPVLEAAGIEDSSLRAGSPGEVPELAGINVLLVDDQPDTMTFVSHFLSSCGAHVRSVSSVDEAMTATTESWPDVLVTDVAMPREDGFSLLSRVRAQEKEVTVIALTAYGSPEERDRFLSAGFDEYIPKPSSALHIARTIAATHGAAERSR